MILEQIVSVPKAAEVLGGISPWTVYSWLSKGILPRVKVGARTMVRVADLQRLISEGTQIQDAVQIGSHTTTHGSQLEKEIGDGGKSPTGARGRKRKVQSDAK